MIGLFPRPPRRLALLGAHCDDIAIGLGATLLAGRAGHDGAR